MLENSEKLPLLYPGTQLDISNSFFWPRKKANPNIWVAGAANIWHFSLINNLKLQFNVSSEVKSYV